MLAIATTLVVAGAAFVWWRFYFFHRNPDRDIPSGSDALSPADGRILYVEDVELHAGSENPYHERVREAFQVDGRWTVIATYLSIFDAHFVRSPIAGTVRLHHVTAVNANASMGGSFFTAALRRPLPLGRRSYTEKNEFLGVSISGEVTVLLVLMADWWIDQIYSLVNDGDVIARGQVIGKIQMGSQVDLWMPVGSIAHPPEIGQKVVAGLTELR